MNNPTAKTPDGATVHLCGCCSEAPAHFFDDNLDTLVCHDCQTQLRYAQAHLKVAGIKGCAPDKEAQYREGAA